MCVSRKLYPYPPHETPLEILRVEGGGGGQKELKWGGEEELGSIQETFNGGCHGCFLKQHILLLLTITLVELFASSSSRHLS